jgi:hypothetical protein
VDAANNPRARDLITCTCFFSPNWNDCIERPDTVQGKVMAHSNVQCHGSCVCWPAGDFTPYEINVLERLEALVMSSSLVPMSALCRDQWWDNVYRVLSDVLNRLTSHRLGHLLAVPVIVEAWGCKVATLMYLMVYKMLRKKAPGDEHMMVLSLLADVTVCPHTGCDPTGGKGWSGGRKHPGRLGTDEFVVSLLHLVDPHCDSGSRRSKDMYKLLIAAGCRPSCHCGSPYLEDDPAAVKLDLARWHRWWPRHGKRAWVALLMPSS